MRIFVPLLRPDPAMKVQTGLRPCRGTTTPKLSLTLPSPTRRTPQGFGRVKQLPVILFKAVVLAPLCQARLWVSLSVCESC